jgi:HK97 family phage major capsid protein
MDPLRSKLAEVDGHLTELRQQAGDKWNALEAAKGKLAEAPGVPTQDSPEFRALDEAGKAYGDLADAIAATEAVKRGIVDSLVQSGQAPELRTGEPSRDREQRGGDVDRRSPGQRVVESDEYRQLVESGILNSKAALGVRQLGQALTRDEVKALITGGSDTSGGAFVQPDRIGYFPLVPRQLTIADLITVGTTDSDLVEYVEQTGFVNSAAPVAEATDVTGTSGVKPQSDLAFIVRQTGVRTLAHWMAATRRSLADAGQMRTLIDGWLRYGLERVVEDQIVAGDGTGENLRGILNTTGTNAVPAGAQSHADKVHFGITAVRVDNFEPSGVVMNPVDWETVRLSREDGAGAGAYLFGPPSQVGASTLWGLPVAVSQAMPQGTALVGDLRAAMLWVREGTQVLASDSHADFFVRNLVAVLAENRVAFGVPYPQALAEVNLAAA